MPPQGKRLPITRSAAASVHAIAAAGVEVWPGERYACIRQLLGDFRTFTQAGRAAHLSAATVARFCHARGHPTLRTGLYLARALNCSPWRLLAFRRAMGRCKMQPIRRQDEAYRRIAKRTAAMRQLLTPLGQGGGASQPSGDVYADHEAVTLETEGADQGT